MPTDPSDPSSPQPPTRLYQTTAESSKGGSGGIFFVILLLLLAGGGAAYYFLVSKPAAATAGAAPTPATSAATVPVSTPATAASTPAADIAGNPTYSPAQRAQYIKQADDAFIAVRQGKTHAFTDAFNTLMTSGGFSAVGLTSKAAIAARRDLVGKCQTANDDLEAFDKTEEATFKSELQKTPLIPNDVEYVLGDFTSKAQTEKNVQLRDLQRDSFKTGDELLAYLDKNFGSWSLNTSQHLTFKPGVAAAFNAIGKTYNDQVTAMNKLQADIKATVDPSATPDLSPTPGQSASPAASAAPGTPTASVKP